MATAKKRKLDSISDGPAPSEPEAKRHHTTNRCRLTELPDELLILIAAHLAGFDDPITYVHRMDGKLIIEHPKVYHDVSLAGLRDLSGTLCTEFEKALHRNGIVTFEDQNSFNEYFDSEVLNSDPRLMSIRLATQHMRFNIWRLDWSTIALSTINLLANLKKVHLGGAWKSKDGPVMFTPTNLNVSSFKHQACRLLISLRMGRKGTPISHVTFGPGCFGYNTVFHSESDEDFSAKRDVGARKGVNHVTFGELLATWNEDQGFFDGLTAIWDDDEGIPSCTGSIVSMDEETLSCITKYCDSIMGRKSKTRFQKAQ